MDIGFIYAIGAAILWGLVYTIDQKILYGVSPFIYLFVTSVLVVIIMIPFAFYHNESIKNLFHVSKITWYLFFLSAGLTTLASFFILSGVKNLGASTVSIIEIAYPPFVILFSFIFFRAIPNIYFFIGGTLIFIGSLIIIKFS